MAKTNDKGPMAESQRRLAAIMFTDIVGYTALGQRNEALSLALLDEHRKMLRPVFARHNGREVKTMGDAFLVQFASALEAVRCAYDIQRASREFNISLPGEKRVRLRVGIHVGDVVETQGDILGDAVNLASRIEPLSEDGGVCVTRQVYDQVRNKFELPMISLGTKSLKDVGAPLELYKMQMPWSEGTENLAIKPDKKRIAILPMVNMTADPTEEYFADGMTEELISTISVNSGLRVISRTSAMSYKGTRKGATEIGKELGVGAILEGSIRKAGNLVRIAIQLIDVNTDELLWSQKYDKELSDVFAIQTDIATQVAGALKVTPKVREEYQIEKRFTEDTEAHMVYLKGLYHMHKETEAELNTAMKYFELATDKDQGFALAYVGLADCYGLLASYGYRDSKEAFSKARSLVLKALEIDENIPEAHAVFGTILQDYYWDLPGAEKEFKRAMELNPNWAEIPHCYADYLALTGRLNQAIAELGRAEELDPLSLDIRNCAAWTLTVARSSDRAIEECKKMLETNPNFVPAYDKLERAYLHKSMYDEAVETMEKAVAVSGGSARAKAYLGHAYAMGGQIELAEKVHADLQKMAKTQYVSPLFLAVVCAGLNHKEEAFEWLERAYQERTAALVKLKVDPIYDNLRSDPRFGLMLRKIGLE